MTLSTPGFLYVFADTYHLKKRLIRKTLYVFAGTSAVTEGLFPPKARRHAWCFIRFTHTSPFAPRAEAPFRLVGRLDVEIGHPIVPQCASPLEPAPAAPPAAPPLPPELCG